MEMNVRAESEARLDALLRAEAQQPFDLTRGPLIRAVLVRLNEADHALLVVMHHTISDGWSLAVFFRELETCYRAFSTGNGAPDLPQLPMQYADFAQWQRQWMQGAVLEGELNYWKRVLAGAPARLELPTDRDEPPEPSRKAARRRVELPEPLAAGVAKLCHDRRSTPFVVLLSALGLTFQKWTQQQDMVIGTVVAGRNRREFENILGCFMNFLPIRLRIAGVQTCEQLLDNVRASVLEAQAHQDCPFEKIVEALNPERTLNQNPLYNVGLLLQNFPAQLFPSDTLPSYPIPSGWKRRCWICDSKPSKRLKAWHWNANTKQSCSTRQRFEQLLASFCHALETLVRSRR